MRKLIESTLVSLDGATQVAMQELHNYDAFVMGREATYFGMALIRSI